MKQSIYITLKGEKQTKKKLIYLSIESFMNYMEENLKTGEITLRNKINQYYYNIRTINHHLDFINNFS